MADQRSAYCAEQIRRLKGLDFFPSDELARGELIKTLVRNSDSNAHAEAIITRCLSKGFGSDGRACPTVRELAEVCSEVNPTKAVPVAHRGCPHCFGSGWAPDVMIAATGTAFAERQYSGVRRCSCVGGKARVAAGEVEMTR